MFIKQKTARAGTSSRDKKREFHLPLRGVESKRLLVLDVFKDEDATLQGSLLDISTSCEKTEQ